MNKTEEFMLYLFGHDVKHIEVFKRKQITKYKLWAYITEEQFRDLNLILENKDSLGIVVYSIFISSIERLNSEIKALNTKDLARLKKKIYDKKHKSRLEIKAKAKIQTKEYRNRPEVKQNYINWYNTLETKAKRKEQRQSRRKIKKHLRNTHE
mgnify:FL=1|jgi:hypothetical protein|tara:strand:+ start:126 stop:584 length:459 start_codon:yes stop_codon:yes gene_type:complete